MRHTLIAAAVIPATIAALMAFAGTANATATTYTVSHTWGPYNGALPTGATVPCGPRSACTAPGSVPDFDEAPHIACNNAHDAMLGGNAVVDTKTPGHPTAKAPTVDLDRLGVFWDSEIDRIEWGTWIRPNGKAGWSSVTITATCLVRK